MYLIGDAKMTTKKVVNQDWRKVLDEHTYRITREGGTEAPFTGKYLHTTDAGTYHCVCCGEALFASDTKFDAGCGWPSFYAPKKEEAIDEKVDLSHGKIGRASCRERVYISEVAVGLSKENETTAGT